MAHFSNRGVQTLVWQSWTNLELEKWRFDKSKRAHFYFPALPRRGFQAKVSRSETLA